jgi:hypothetical protein
MNSPLVECRAVGLPGGDHRLKGKEKLLVADRLLDHVDDRAVARGDGVTERAVMPGRDIRPFVLARHAALRFHSWLQGARGTLRIA